jgi:uncharacterized protein
LLEDVVGIIRDKCRAGAVKPVFHLTTNGTIIHDDFIELVKDNDFDLRISLDGPKAVHDRSRAYPDGSGSFSKVMSTIQRLNEAGIPFTVNTVYSPDHSFRSLVRFFEDTGIRRVDFFPLWISDDRINGYFSRVEDFKKDLEDYTLDLIDRLKSGGETGASIVEIEKCMIDIFGFRKSEYYCSAGRGYLGLSMDGRLFPCLKFIDREEYQIGDIDRGLDIKKLNDFRTLAAPPSGRLLRCSRCKIRQACKGMCYADRLDAYKSAASFNFYCLFHKNVMKAARKIYDSFIDEDPDILIRVAGIREVFAEQEE